MHCTRATVMSYQPPQPSILDLPMPRWNLILFHWSAQWTFHLTNHSWTPSLAKYKLAVYCHPPPLSDSVVIHEDAPPFPRVPLEGYYLQPTECSYVPINQEQLHLSSLSVTLSQSHLIEEATRSQSATPKWHSLRKVRVTASHFREVSHVSPSKAENLAERIIWGARQTEHMKRGLEMELGAWKDYATWTPELN